MIYYHIMIMYVDIFSHVSFRLDKTKQKKMNMVHARLSL
jgi:hypothetical protein